MKLNTRSHGYGSAEYYSELFQDILADVEGEISPDAPKNIYKGFLLAIDDWMNYHGTQFKEYQEFKSKVLETLGTL